MTPSRECVTFMTQQPESRAGWSEDPEERFDVLKPAMTVDQVRQRLGEHGYGVVVAKGSIRACIRGDDLADFRGNARLADVIDELAPAPVLPQEAAEHIDSVARHVRDEMLACPAPSGVVLVDGDGKPRSILRRRLLLSALASGSPGYRGLPEGVDYPAEGREAAAGGGTAGDSLMVTRFGELTFPAEVQVGAQCSLGVVLRRRPEAGTALVELALKAADWPLEVTVTLVNVDPGDFLVEGRDAGIVVVPRDGDSSTARFVLVPQSPGEKQIRLRFEQRHAFLSMARVRTRVVDGSAHAGRAVVSSAPRLEHPGRPPDVTLYVDLEQGNSYTVRVRTREDAAGVQPHLVDRLTFRRDPVEFVRETFEELSGAQRILTAQEFDRLVRKLGSAMYERLFRKPLPGAGYPGFGDFYWGTLRQRASSLDPALRWRTLQVVSEQPDIPWELLRPSRRRADGSWQADTFLCERFELSRWLSAAVPPATVQLNDLTLVAPPSNLAWVADEVRALRLMALNVTVIEKKSDLERFLRYGRADILHFACHGKFDALDPSRSVVLLGDREFTPLDVTAEYRSFARGAPLVFLNACDSGRLGFGITGVDGWAQVFLDAGAGAFVGCMWAVDDAAATRFATRFYEDLTAGETIGAAVRAARQAAARDGDASHLSYTVYANPALSIASGAAVAPSLGGPHDGIHGSLPIPR